MGEIRTQELIHFFAVQNAIIHEGIRLHPGVSTRQDRVAPDQDLVYKSPDGKTYVIPAGVSHAPRCSSHCSFEVKSLIKTPRHRPL